MFARAQRCLPHRTLVALAVALEHEGSIGLAVHARRQRHAHADGQPVPQRAGAGLDARRLAVFRVAAQGRFKGAETIELLWWEEALVRQLEIERQASVALAQDESVALGPMGIVRVVFQHVVEKDTHDFQDGEGRADVPALALLQDPQDCVALTDAALVEAGRIQLSTSAKKWRPARASRTSARCPRDFANWHPRRASGSA